MCYVIAVLTFAVIFYISNAVTSSFDFDHSLNFVFAMMISLRVHLSLSLRNKIELQITANK
jgi:hypothetical protein